MAAVKEKDRTTREKTPSKTSNPGGSSTSSKAASRETRENIVVRTFRETRSELRKVVWPTREETIRLTIVVLAISTAIGVFLGIGDFGFSLLYSLLLGLFQ